MCELLSPPNIGETAFITWGGEKPPPQVGEEFTMPWGAYDVTYKVDVARGPGKFTGRERFDCTVVNVQVAVVE